MACRTSRCASATPGSDPSSPRVWPGSRRTGFPFPAPCSNARGVSETRDEGRSGMAEASAGGTAEEAPLRRLLRLMATLRDPVRGCPWDVAQTPATIVPYTIEEAYEVADAVARGDRDDL